MFEQKVVTQLHPRVGRPMSLSVGHIDPDALTLTFHYREKVLEEGVWHTVEREAELVRGEHYKVDRARGIFKLIDHPLWHREGAWRAGDRVEELLYKGRVKHPQYVEATFDYDAPEPEVEAEKEVSFDWE